MEKTLFIIAGANGSGKTTFAKEFCKENNLEFLNTDEIAKHCKSDIEAGRKFLKLVREKFNQGSSFVIETTLSGKYIKQLIKEAKQKRFKVKLIYIFLSKPEENILRVKQRIVTGGHFVPEEDIKRRYYRSKKLFLELRNFVDSWSLIFNGEDDFVLVAKDNQIYIDELYKKFLEDLNG
ncbi:zeta toxin family protein [Venenivibrio stagnispumantis]|uniref:Predicted ABC-type ATPase n=1 Tax=Venenivibrio stagnispumantis TaxID=407998 RepID=A0AA45WKN8_9AQUI|nr:AAA family ATPase [Venenivibrio stagnispumantis]MCW4573004.1 zeta toxin family protein [Venenivibrio stagnispumantis]SMP07840.1 Predicted ABC-type ATPase [Venenivibrio stagnispumantis]